MSQATKSMMIVLGSTAYVHIHILSGGCDDPGRSHVSNTCGFSYIEVNGKDFSPHSRGYNVVVVDGKTGKAVEARAFDTFGISSSGDHLREYLNSLNGNAHHTPEPRFHVFVTISPTGSTAYVHIHILSGGCDDPGRSHVSNTCGFSYIEVNGKDFSPHSRGYNVVVVDGKTGKAVEARAFDTFGISSSGDHLREYLNSLNGNKIVLVAIQDEGSKFIKSALDALKRLGATHPVIPDYQGSFALVGYAGENKPAWIAQKVAKGGLGPSEISLKIPLAFK
ncbi:Cell migration-inducing and hyaluronan-binding protein [Stylophora pistillata]|uniref:Cell migration-inducing and hyaluronan-binding protein n=1 Tax=Stylophora pistillata TaxID=50429 RepID=A0A2B4R456_STYPI|nr:Cell migration-inducing and hyaluronan-binding protein [Stylophora pistillata]